MHVTVLIIVYNGERYIEEAVDSVVAQDYHDWDILVVDGGSTDRTVEVVKSRMSDDRISLIQTKHRGCAAAMAIGIEHARGPVITSLDSDDKLTPNALSTVMPAFENNPRLGYAWTNWVKSTGEKGDSDFLPDRRTLFEAIISGWFKAYHEKFFRKEFYLQSEGLDTSIKYAEDMQLALLVGKAGCDTLHIPKVTYWRRTHPHQITVENLDETVKDSWRVRRMFSLGSAALTQLYIMGIEKERDAFWNDKNELWNELRDIRECFGYKFMRFYGSVIDRTLPDGTKRGELKRKAVGRLKGSGSVINQALPDGTDGKLGANRPKAIEDYLEHNQVRKLQIGTGPNILDGWLNTDINPGSDGVIFLDAREPFPIDDGAFDYVFGEHLIEHLRFNEGLFMLRECHRVLKPEGRIRIATPDLETLTNLYATQKSDIQKRYVNWVVDTFLPEAGIHNECFVINNAFSNWGHQFIYDHATLRHAMEKAGFVDVIAYRLGESDNENLRGIESHGKVVADEDVIRFETMILEARRC